MSVSESEEIALPKLRNLDARPVYKDGRGYILIRDPMQISGSNLLIPQELGPLLGLCDGTRDASGIRAALTVRYGLTFTVSEIERILKTLDQAFLLENERFHEAMNHALERYRRESHRSPHLAGETYPTDPVELRAQLDSYLDAIVYAPKVESGRGLLSPHIDFERGGVVYAHVWHSARQFVREADLAIILGTDHYGEDVYTLTQQSYATPYGVLPTATSIVDDLAKAIGVQAAFAGELRHQGEHSIELASVWLHHMRDGESIEMAPLLCGTYHPFVQEDRIEPTNPTLAPVLRALRSIMETRNVVMILAGDLAHVGPAFGGSAVDVAGKAEMKTSDDELIDRICAGDAEGFLRSIHEVGDRNNVCGAAPIYLGMRAMEPVSGIRLAYDRCPADGAGTSLVSIAGVVLQ
jgi:AmmeMemoRadiSam system protein B